MSKSKKNITRKKLKMKGRGLGASKMVESKPKSKENSNKKTKKDKRVSINTGKNKEYSASPKTEEELYKSFRKKTLETSLKEEALDFNEALKEEALKYNEDVSTDPNKGIGYMIDPDHYVRENSIDPDQYVGDQIEQKRKDTKKNKNIRKKVKEGPNTRLVQFRERMHQEQILEDFKNDYMKNYYLNNPK